jgi:hypothetical protein
MDENTQYWALEDFRFYLYGSDPNTWRQAIFHWGWFTRDWWEYLLEKKSPEYSWYEVIKCRMFGHPAGVTWYCASGYEPDMTCRGCGDDLG